MKTKVSVLIVGAGPSGLVMALWLKKKEIPFRIIDKNEGPAETSRAVAIQARTLEYYKQLGIADEIIAAGSLAPELILRRKNHDRSNVFMGEFASSISPYPYLLFLPQNAHEKILAHKLQNLNVVIERNTELLYFAQNKHQVDVTVKGPQGEERFAVSYLCGCDGTQSLVRRLLGIKFLGKHCQQDFFVADIETSTALPEKAVQINVNRNDFCVVMPLRGLNLARLTGVVPLESENKENLSFVNVSDYVSRSTGLEIKKVNWFSIYNVNYRVATHFQQGRTFLVGDSAHIHSPVAGQGMNTGIGDAINLAWKLAAVLKGQGSSRILSTYETERRPSAEMLVETTDTAFRFLGSRSFWGSIFRAFILPVVFPILSKITPFVRYAFTLLSQTGTHYRESPLSSGLAGAALAGNRLPWLKTKTGDNYDSLKSLEWHIHIYGRANESFSAVGNFRGFRIYEFEWNKQAAAKGFLKDAFYLIRPDGHIALADAKQNSLNLKKYLNTWDIDYSQNVKSLNAAIRETVL